MALHTGACKAVHVLLSCSGSALCLTGLGPPPGHGRLHAKAATGVTQNLLIIGMARFAALLQSDRGDDSEEAAAEWDRWVKWQG